MTGLQRSRYLRQRAIRVVSDDTGAYPTIAHDLASYVLELLDARDRGAAIEDDRVSLQLAQLRDDVHDSITASERRRDALLGLLEQRVNGLARRLEQIAGDAPRLRPVPDTTTEA